MDPCLHQQSFCSSLPRGSFLLVRPLVSYIQFTVGDLLRRVVVQENGYFMVVPLLCN